MGYIKTSIDFDVNKMRKEFGARADRAQTVLDSLILHDCEPFVPLREGDLRESGDTGGENGNKGGVMWEEDYATYQYYGKRYEHRTPGTRARWFEYAKSLHLREWIDAVQEALLQHEFDF